MSCNIIEVLFYNIVGIGWDLFKFGGVGGGDDGCLGGMLFLDGCVDFSLIWLFWEEGKLSLNLL